MENNHPYQGPDHLATLPRIGTDEAGKGDYFGDLVVAGVYLDAAGEERARALGVKDSKQLSDARVQALARDVRAAFPHDVVRISPAKYNELYDKMHNLNALLAWAHARVIENLLPRTGAQLVVSDQFGNAAVLEQALMQAGRQVRLVQMHPWRTRPGRRRRQHPGARHLPAAAGRAVQRSRASRCPKAPPTCCPSAVNSMCKAVWPC